MKKEDLEDFTEKKRMRAESSKKQKKRKRDDDDDFEDAEDTPTANSSRNRKTGVGSAKEKKSSSSRKVEDEGARPTKSANKGRASKKAKTEEENTEWKWWLEKKDGEEEGIKWNTLEWNGVLFPPAYEPHGVKFYYGGEPIDLTPEQEEAATFYAQYLEVRIHLIHNASGLPSWSGSLHCFLLQHRLSTSRRRCSMKTSSRISASFSNQHPKPTRKSQNSVCATSRRSIPSYRSVRKRRSRALKRKNRRRRKKRTRSRRSMALLS